MDDPAPNIFPALRYHDASAAIEWLCLAFGFERLASIPGRTAASRTPSRRSARASSCWARIGRTPSAAARAAAAT
jgi:uncharacterized glyoxalase superfamily protein PhnB